MIRSDEILDDHLTMREVSRMYGLYAKVGLPVFNCCWAKICNGNR